MNFKQLFTEDRAVSPVIGVILMVAITVILAAVIGTFVLGLGDQVSESAPQAQFTFDYDGDNKLNIAHDGGDAIEADTLNISSAEPLAVSGNGGTTYNDSSGTDVTATGTNETSINLIDAGAFSSDDELTAGTDIDILADSSFNGETVRVVWQSPNSDSTATIGKFEA